MKINNMTQEEKAKAYDKALERAKIWKDKSGMPADKQGILDDIFLELKESEDGRIRKELIKHLRDGAEGYMPAGNAEDYTRWLAWLEKQGECHISHDDKIMIKQLTEYFTTGHGLQNTNETVVEWLNNVKKKLEKRGEIESDNDDIEAEEKGIREAFNKIEDEKQGEQKPILNVPTREVILSIWDLGNEWKELTNGCISTEYGTQLDYIQKHWHESEYYLREKQGEHKPSIEMITPEESLGIDSDTYNKIVDECIYGEQKPVDKVEPKFKVGDKIIKFSKTPCPVHGSTDDTVCEVVEVQDACYILNTKEGKIQEPFEWQDYYKFVEPKTTWSERMKRNLKVTFLPISALITSILKEQNTML